MRSPIPKPQFQSKRIFQRGIRHNIPEINDIFNGSDPIKAIASGRVMANAWSQSLKGSNSTSRFNFIIKVIESYWKHVHISQESLPQLPALFTSISPSVLDNSVISVANAIGQAASKLDVIEASFQLGNLYTAVLPEATRSLHGIFYTPPSLTHRLIQISQEAGVNWETARVIDPACGGGAFLAPVSLKILKALQGRTPIEIIEHIESHLQGYEIDPFGAWLSQVFVEVALKEVTGKASRRIKPLVIVCNSLELCPITEESKFDLVIGNPPYGKISLQRSLREKFAQSLYGHANLYGLFTHLAIDLVKEKGVVGFLTPTSFLSGEYFKKLREFIRENSTPIQTDFISFRKGVFDGVLQETMLTTYKKVKSIDHRIQVNQITTVSTDNIDLKFTGHFNLSPKFASPWILPRVPEQSMFVNVMAGMKDNLNSWGYQVSTGPLVWNRHKSQLIDTSYKNTYPVIWSEAVTQDGSFILRAEKRNHKPFFKFIEGDKWLLVQKECIILQRTTAKEQEKRLIAAILPKKILREYKGVIVENHLNMILPIVNEPSVKLEVLNVFLNSKAVNDSFRTISGSVAVSAYELESLPLPSPKKLKRLIELINKVTEKDEIEKECFKIFQSA